jgi:hypothetical protein
MEQKGNQSKPFLLKRVVTPKPTLLSPESATFNERVESYVRFVQGANAFVAVGASTSFKLYIYFNGNFLK